MAAGTTYTYRIKAINDHGVSRRSRWFHIDTPAAPQAIFVEDDNQDDQGEQDDPASAPGVGTAPGPGHTTAPGPGGRAGVSEVSTADLPADTTTTGLVEVGEDGWARGSIKKPTEFSTDIGTLNDPDIIYSYVFDTDWFAVVLGAGRTYRIEMKGQILRSPGLNMPGVPIDPELTLRLPQINAIYDADGDYLLNTWSRDESSAHHLFRVTFHARAGGTYYIAASGESFEAGGYELRVTDIT